MVVAGCHSAIKKILIGYFLADLYEMYNMHALHFAPLNQQYVDKASLARCRDYAFL
jgi:hypothetical protein